MRSIFDALPAPFAHYMMNDNLATDVILDSIGDHHGAVKDATGTATSAFHSVVGKKNRAQDFDGTDDYIEIDDHAAFTPALTPFSISAWVYMHDATNFIIASKGVAGVDPEWAFWLSSADIIYMRIMDLSVPAYIGRYFNAALTAYQNQWVHLAATYDGGILNAGIKIYLDGVQIDDTNFGSGTFVAAENLTHAIWIGTEGANCANGVFDNVRFFNKELTGIQVMKLADFKKGKESIYAPRPNRIYGTNLNRSSIFGV